MDEQGYLLVRAERVFAQEGAPVTELQWGAATLEEALKQIDEAIAFLEDRKKDLQSRKRETKKKKSEE